MTRKPVMEWWYTSENKIEQGIKPGHSLHQSLFCQFAFFPIAGGEECYRDQVSENTYVGTGLMMHLVCYTGQSE